MRSRKPFLEPNDPILVQTALSVPLAEITGPSCQADIEKLLNIAFGEQGERSKPLLVGLAAPQVGVTKRIILVDAAADGKGGVGDLRVYINPEVTWKSDEQTIWYEGCFSTDRVCGIVSRPQSIKVRAYDRHANLMEETLTNYAARIFLHELDHLNGIEFVSHISNDDDLHWVEESEFPAYRKNEAWRTWPHKCSRQKWEQIKGSA